MSNNRDSLFSLLLILVLISVMISPFQKKANTSKKILGYFMWFCVATTLAYFGGFFHYIEGLFT